MYTKFMFWESLQNNTEYIPKELSMLHNLGWLLASEVSKKEKKRLKPKVTRLSNGMYMLYQSSDADSQSQVNWNVLDH